MEIAEFLMARIAEDEFDALPHGGRHWRADETGGKVRQVEPTEFGLPDVMSESDTHLTAAHIARWHPARVLAECEAKRRIVTDWQEAQAGKEDAGVTVALEWPVRRLAAVYADHPDFREEWKP